MKTPSPEAGRWRRDAIALGALMLLGGALRILHITEVTRAPDYRHPVVDAATHDYWARGLAFGEWTPPAGQPDPAMASSPYFRPPAYPYFLAAIYAVSGGSLLAPRIVQMLLGLCSALLVFLIGRRWFGRTTAFVGAAGMVLWWVLLYFETELLAPALLLPLLLGAFWFLGLWHDTGRLRHLLPAAVLLGLACLGRPTVLAFVPVAVLWVAWECRAARPLRPARSRTRSLALFIVPLVVVVGLATLRNAVVGHDRVLVSSNGGVNLYIGNNPQANGFAANELPGLGRFGTCFDYVHILHALERRLHEPVSHSRASRWFAGEAWSWMRQHPASAAGLMVRKACLLWGNAEVGNNKELALERENSSVLRWLPGPFAALAAAAVLGAVLVWRRRNVADRSMAFLLGSFVVVLIGATVPFFAAARFRVPALPMLFLFAGVVVQSVQQEWRTGSHRNVALLLAAFAALWLTHWALPWRATPDRAAWEFTRGAAWMADGQDADAEAAFRRALAIEPRHYQAHHNLGLLLARHGDTRRAIEEWRAALDIRPDAAPVLASLGAALLVEGQPDAAVTSLQRAVALEPDVAEFHANLARALQKEGRVREALRSMRRAAELAPRDRSLWMALASMALAAGDLEDMLGGWREAYRLQPDPAVANNLAWVLATHPQGSVRNGTEAMRLASSACRATNNAVRPYLDTLAAAQAEVGDFEAATRTTQKSLALVDAEQDPELVQRLRERLASYAAGIALRDDTLPPARTASP